MPAFARKSVSLMIAGLFAAGLYGAMAEEAEARKSKGGGKHHSHSHHKPNKPHHKPSHGHGHNNHKHHHGHNHHHKYDRWHHNHNHYGRWVAGGMAAGITAAAIGSVIYSLPSGCVPVYAAGVKYWDCGAGVWYQPRYYGSNVNYVAVAPR